MDAIIHLSVDLHCGTHRAFELFTIDRLLEQWLAPGASVEPVIGGKYELFWNLEDRTNNSTLGCRITAVGLDQFLSFEWRGPAQFASFANAADPLTHVVVFFIPSGDNTIVHLIHSGWRSSAEWERHREWQQRAWSIAFEQLKQLLNA